MFVGMVNGMFMNEWYVSSSISVSCVWVVLVVSSRCGMMDEVLKSMFEYIMVVVLLCILVVICLVRVLSGFGLI